MGRLRLNNLGDLTGSVNGLTLSSATTNSCSWASSPLFPLIAGIDFAALIAEPGAAHEEIMYLYGFTPGGTTGLVLRAAEPNSQGQQIAFSHAGVAWWSGPTASDFKSPSSRRFARAYWR
jgi:hypothetical protein